MEWRVANNEVDGAHFASQGHGLASLFKLTLWGLVHVHIGYTNHNVDVKKYDVKYCPQRHKAPAQVSGED